ncbi:acyltransferase [Aurantiacibacter xanthus]|uniref:Acyltransferase n=1 Tax=Aurantiacibacter xanthus TaxID=1784712 RepID=A0A3A1P562_9SPHN|nr:acyltransferase [Aurantiacibacter xanthus]RIV88575.1 acyltransferase [Aurantiacibacter xanthus]
MIYNFQALRAFAVFLVLFVHIEDLVASVGISQSMLAFGNVGVDLFFVLSGFVIVHSTIKTNPSATEFFKSRLVRIVPIYWILTLGVFSIALFSPNLLGSTQANFANLLKSLFFIPYERQDGSIFPILFVGWSLNYEMFFYTIFAVFLALFSKVKQSIIASSTLITTLVVVISLTNPVSVPVHFLGQPIVLEFVFGMWIGYLANRQPSLTIKGAQWILVAAIAWLVAYMFAWPSGPRWILAGVPSVIILVSALSLERSGIVATNSKVQLLGASSYAIYLSHPFVLQGISKLVPPLTSVSATIAIVATGFAVALAAGVAVHLLIELPVVRYLKRTIIHRSQISASTPPT